MSFFEIEFEILRSASHELNNTRNQIDEQANHLQIIIQDMELSLEELCMALMRVRNAIVRNGELAANYIVALNEIINTYYGAEMIAYSLVQNVLPETFFVKKQGDIQGETQKEESNNSYSLGDNITYRQSKGFIAVDILDYFRKYKPDNRVFQHETVALNDMVYQYNNDISNLLISQLALTKEIPSGDVSSNFYDSVMNVKQETKLERDLYSGLYSFIDKEFPRGIPFETYWTAIFPLTLGILGRNNPLLWGRFANDVRGFLQRLHDNSVRNSVVENSDAKEQLANYPNVSNDKMATDTRDDSSVIKPSFNTKTPEPLLVEENSDPRKEAYLGIDLNSANGKIKPEDGYEIAAYQGGGIAAGIRDDYAFVPETMSQNDQGAKISTFVDENQSKHEQTNPQSGSDQVLITPETKSDRHSEAISITAAATSSFAALGLGVKTALQDNKSGIAKENDCGDHIVPVAVAAVKKLALFSGDLRGEYKMLGMIIVLFFIGRSIAAGLSKNKQNHQTFRIGYGESAVINGGIVQDKTRRG